METLARVIVLTVAGACGVNARFWLGVLLARWLGTRFPWATFLINVSGSFAIGLGAMLLASRWPDPLVRIAALTGFLGGYTTFSAYMLESLTLWERGDRTLAVGNLLGSLVAGLLAVALGVGLGRWLVQTPSSPFSQVIKSEQRLEAISAALAGQEPSDSPPS